LARLDHGDGQRSDRGSRGESAPEPTAEPLPQPEPTAVLPPRTCADDPRLCTPAPEPTIGGPLT
ncbi:hypothetical protein C5D04_17480, partial [Rathayibacter sp. AY1D2]|uniref:hypothetical protein n=1 Tax=Rathayibacter sp. AY1D2 TaxID=2080543 RepID=UPI000D4FE6B9